MVARPPPSLEWTLHPGLTDYEAVRTLWEHTHTLRILMLLLLLLRMLDEVEDDDTAGADVAEQPGKIQGDATPNG